MGLRVIFTGASGRIGQDVVQTLLDHGHEILNLDRIKLDNPNVYTMICDTSDPAQVFSALCTHMRYGEPFPARSPLPPDAVIHFAALSTPMLAPDNEIFRCNVMSTHNVIEAACKLGIKKVIIASSITVYGVAFADGVREYPSFPLTEDLDVNPTDPYALSKIISERIARTYATRYGIDIYCLRIGRTFRPDDYKEDQFQGYIDNPTGIDAYAHGWSYTDARDLGHMCHRGLEVAGLGWQVFNATNDNITNKHQTMAFLQKNYPHIRITEDLEGRDAPISNRKIKDMLGFRQSHDWRSICGFPKET